MSAYYNENDPFAAAWLRELIKARLIADGDVDERSIEDVKAEDVRGYTQAHFFAGIGGWSYALRRAGWPDDRAVWTGSCPCQPWSLAGLGAEASDPRHLWPTWFRLIAECNPVVVFGEQVAKNAGFAWLDVVQTDMESLAYAVGAVCLPACSVGAPEERERLWFVADADRQGLARSGPFVCAPSARQSSDEWRAITASISDDSFGTSMARSAGSRQPMLYTGDDGLFNAVGRLRGYGNAIVPQVAQVFIEAYCEARGLMCGPSGTSP